MNKIFTGLFLLFFAGYAFAGEIAEQLLAVVNGRIIFLSDLRRDAAFFSEGNLPALRDQIDRRINHELLLDEAKRFISEAPSPKQIEIALQKIQSRFENLKIFLERLREAGIRLEALQEELVDRLWIETLLRDRITFFIFVSEEEIAQYAKEHPETVLQWDAEQRDAQIRALLEKEKERAKTEEYITQLRSRATIEIAPHSPHQFKGGD